MCTSGKRFRSLRFMSLWVRFVNIFPCLVEFASGQDFANNGDVGIILRIVFDAPGINCEVYPFNLSTEITNFLPI